jgi:hypothetical protein
MNEKMLVRQCWPKGCVYRNHAPEPRDDHQASPGTGSESGPTPTDSDRLGPTPSRLCETRSRFFMAAGPGVRLAFRVYALGKALGLQRTPPGAGWAGGASPRPLSNKILLWVRMTWHIDKFEINIYQDNMYIYIYNIYNVGYFSFKPLRSYVLSIYWSVPSQKVQLNYCLHITHLNSGAFHSIGLLDAHVVIDCIIAAVGVTKLISYR